MQDEWIELCFVGEVELIAKLHLYFSINEHKIEKTPGVVLT
jgi:hypothetical protein